MADGAHRWIVDSIEEQAAAVEIDGRQVIPLPLWLLPEGVMEGHVLSVAHERGDKQSSIRITIDHTATHDALKRSEEQVRTPRGSDPGGDVKL
jgi:hypothetical protein